MSVIVRDVQYHTIDTDQLKVLLLYAEQDMHNHDRQATAFNLLKAIISRKLIVDEIHEVMKKVAEMSIISELSYIRAQARTVFHQYFMEYPLGERLEKYLTFYISQMSYEMQYGRESAIEMISTFISSFPMVSGVLDFYYCFFSKFKIAKYLHVLKRFVYFRNFFRLSGFTVLFLKAYLIVKTQLLIVKD